MTETFTDSLRRRLLEASKFCPTCGQPPAKDSYRAFALRVGVPHSTLWRFMRGGDTSGETIDAIVRFLGGPV